MDRDEIRLPQPPSIASRLSSIYQAVLQSLSPLPAYPNQPGNETSVAEGKLLADVQKLGFNDVDTLLQALNSSFSGVINDDNLLQEHLVQLLYKLPPESKAGKKITDGFINTLWNGLSHPPVSTLGERYRYREPDGSNNSLTLEKLGAAHTPYARSVRPEVYQPGTDLPDPDIIFDMLMSRDDAKDGDHPNGISSMLFYLATIIIHDIFQTDRHDPTVNLTSSYLDLAPLYGRNRDEQNSMRTFKDGLLKPDCFSSKRLLGFPPGSGVFLIMFNRFHNYVVTQLASIDEGGRFTKPKDVDDINGWIKYDNDLFQHGRLITCGLYVNIVLKDYVRTILSLNRTNSTWSLDPRTQEGKNFFSKPVAEGIGNQVSVEFNLIYRWHSALSKRDEQWTINEFERLLPGKDPISVDWHEILVALCAWEDSLSDDPEQRPFAGLMKFKDGTFDDDNLVQILQDSIEDLAGSFGANRIPKILKSVEILGMTQARQWNVATLNEFRAFVGLTKHATFEDINPDPEVARKLMRLYDSPDAVELYPGLVAEKPKPPMTPGSGLCVNVTTSYAILSDATTLVRGDRFYTTDYSPKNLTNWGYNEVNYDLNVDQGHVMSKLIFRAFPNHFKSDSIYAHMPFVIPSENTLIMKKLGKMDVYSWDPPARQGSMTMIKSNQAVQQILNDKKDFKVSWGPAIERLTARPNGSFAHNFCLAGDRQANAANREHIIRALYPPGWEDDLRDFYTGTVRDLVQQHSFNVRPGSKEVDVVRDVISLANTRMSAAMFSLPLKSEDEPRGVFTEGQLRDALTACFMSIFMDADPANSFKLRAGARTVAQQLGRLVQVQADIVSKTGGFLHDIWAAFVNRHPGNGPAALSQYGDHMIQRMLQMGKSVEEVVWGSIMPLAAAGNANQNQLLTQCLDYYLGEGKGHLTELRRLAMLDTKEADETLMKYMLEGCRLRGGVAVYRDVDKHMTITDYDPCVPDPSDPTLLRPVPNPNPTKKTIQLSAGSRIMLNLLTAGHDATAFPDPESVHLDRPIESYMQYGWGPHQCLGLEASRVILATVFKELVRLKELQRVPGPQGRLKSMPASVWQGQSGRVTNDQAWDGLRVYMTADQSSYWPIPTTLRIRWEG